MRIAPIWPSLHICGLARFLRESKLNKLTLVLVLVQVLQTASVERGRTTDDTATGQLLAFSFGSAERRALCVPRMSKCQRIPMCERGPKTRGRLVCQTPSPIPPAGTSYAMPYAQKHSPSHASTRPVLSPMPLYTRASHDLEVRTETRGRIEQGIEGKI